MNRTPVESSNVVSVGYDQATRVLEVEFKGAAVYTVANVPPDIHQDFMGSNSKGAFYAAHIRKNSGYVITKVAA